jgi:metallo-beta-lactamase family protein
MLLDAASIQESDHEHLVKRGRAGPESEPLYTRRDAVRVQELSIGVPYRRPFHLRKHMTFEFLEAGHILGSASVDLRISEGTPHRLVFSGDIGRSGLPIIRDPEPPTGPIDTLIIESTYGDRDHQSPEDAMARLAEVITRVAGRGGKVLVPAFALGRAQELVYDLHSLWHHKRIPELPIYVDSPMAVDVTEVFRLHPEVFDQREALARRTNQPFDFPLVRYVRESNDSKKLNTLQGPAVIIAASGMMEGGRILHHLLNHAGDHRNCILVVGFQAEHTLGRRIVEGATTIKIFGQEVERRAEVEVINGYSAHADRGELRRWVRALGGPVARAFVVHGEDGPRRAMAEILREEGVREVHLPGHGETFEA